MFQIMPQWAVFIGKTEYTLQLNSLMHSSLLPRAKSRLFTRLSQKGTLKTIPTVVVLASHSRARRQKSSLSIRVPGEAIMQARRMFLTKGQ